MREGKEPNKRRSQGANEEKEPMRQKEEEQRRMNESSKN
jgi:hypothetical protein